MVRLVFACNVPEDMIQEDCCACIQLCGEGGEVFAVCVVPPLFEVGSVLGGVKPMMSKSAKMKMKKRKLLHGGDERVDGSSSLERQYLSREPYLSNKVLGALYEFYLDRLVAGLRGLGAIPSIDVGVSIYGGPRAGSAFSMPVLTSTASLSCSVTMYTVQNVSLLLTQMNPCKIWSELSDSLSHKDKVPAFVSQFPSPSLVVKSPPSSFPNFKVSTFPSTPAAITTSEKPTLACTVCGKKLTSVLSTISHFTLKHTSEAIPWCPCEIDEKVYKLHHPLSRYKRPSQPRPRPSQFIDPLQVPYIDDHYAVVVKPQGMPTQGGDNPLNTSDLLLAVSYPTKWHKGWTDPYVPSSSSPPHPPPEDALGKARPCHRLDSPTGGLVLCARTRFAIGKTSQLFGDKSALQKRYRAIVFGRIELDFGEINEPVDGKESKSLYKVVSRGEFVSTVDLWPVTGRTHQLRKHMLHLGHGIVGDKTYGPSTGTPYNYTETDGGGFNPHARLCLWALQLEFTHPFTGDPHNVQIPEPEWYNIVRRNEKLLAQKDSQEIKNCERQNDKSEC